MAPSDNERLMVHHRRIWENDMIESRTWKREAALVGLLAGSAAFAQPVGYDFNDDGSSDYPVSIISYDAANPDVGAARIWSGASKSIIHTIVGTDTNTLFGWSTGSAGDLNGDDKADLIVGEPLWSAASDYEGRIQVFSGNDASVLLTITGPYVDSGLGRYVIGIDDWDGDGISDIAVSGWDIADTDSDGIGDDPIGMVFIFSGDDGSLLTEITDPTATSSFGYSIFGLGDITGDGKADIAITDPHAELVAGSGTPGQLYIFEGSATATAYDLTDAYRTISNSDPSNRMFAAQVDVMHPDLWLDEPTLQVISLTEPGNGGPNEAPILIDILKANGVASGTKGARSSLQLAGDINLDGKVDSADLQDSISQLGTNPQAIGVMPIADSNGDNIIDATDIQVVVNGYGATTDIYEGLWDGTRLLSIAAGAAGFGSTANISGGAFGGSQPGGGRRPIDDCPPVIIAPPNITASMVPTLLREDAERSCNDCPEYEDEPSCYECESDKSVSGGSVSASPSEPSVSETVTFTVSGVSEIPGTLKCIEDCGDDGNTAQTPLGDLSYVWEVLTKNENGWPEESDPNDGHVGWPTGESIEVGGGEYCLEKKAICWAKPSGPCVPDPAWTRIGEKEVKWEDFEIASLTAVEWPLNRERTTIGIAEVVVVFVDPYGTASADWYIDGVYASSGPALLYYAPDVATNAEIKAVINSCEQTISFTVIEPTRVNYVPCPTSIHHQGGARDVGFWLLMNFDPDNVSFGNLESREGEAVGVGTSGDYLTLDMSSFNHPASSDWQLTKDDNFIDGFDLAYSIIGPNHTPQGAWHWDIPIEYRALGSSTIHQLGVIRQSFVDTSTCTSVSKGGMTATGCSTDMQSTYGNPGNCFD